MNIKNAKAKIKDAVYLYLKKNDQGEYIIPLDKQRPVFLLGSPGVGKTAIVSQIAKELDIGFVSYSMTHHTRQSALGLPKIEEDTYEDMTYDVSRYTMSEIIAAIYDEMRVSGKKEGILFLDEINCVSETLAPAMLLFLQFKIFGSYHVPEGWVIVTAGNPPIYNRQVKEFDIVTLDRLRVINVEADYDSFRDYAVAKNLHPAVISYLDAKKDNFYIVSNSQNGRQYVTARGWEDLSRIITLSEQEGITVDEELIGQYLNHSDIANDFFNYYELFNRYKKDYRIKDILMGNDCDDVVRRANEASFDERIAVLELILEHLRYNSKDLKKATDKLSEVKNSGEYEKELFVECVNNLKKKSDELVKQYDNAFKFVADAFDNNEMVLFTGEISMNEDTCWVIAHFKVESYSRYSAELMMSDKGEDLKEKCNRILKSIEEK